MKVLSFSTKFPAHHPRKGEETNFLFKIWNSLGINVEVVRYISDVYDIRPWDRSKGLFYAGLPPKGHTIRKGNRWKEGEYFSPRFWSGSAYNRLRDGSRPIEFAPPIKIEKIWNIRIETGKIGNIWINDYLWQRPYDELAENDGLSVRDFIDWIIAPVKKKEFIGQIICWDKNIDYDLGFK